MKFAIILCFLLAVLYASFSGEMLGRMHVLERVTLESDEKDWLMEHFNTKFKVWTALATIELLGGIFLLLTKI